MITIKKNKKLLIQLLYGVAMIQLAFFSCTKPKLEPVDTYPEPPTPLVKFLEGSPSPSQGTEGSVVTFKISGLDGKDTSDFKFFINQTEAQVVEIDSVSIKVKVPANASTGGSAVLINGEYYFGPSFTVKGKISIDLNFDASVNHSDKPINGILRNADNNFLLYGSFNDYGNKSSVTNTITGLAEIDANGNYIADGSGAGKIQMGKLGLNGKVSSVLQLPSNDYILSGSFSQYDTVRNINNVIEVSNTGGLNTMVMDVVNPDPVNNPNANKDTVPSFNGGVQGSVVRAFSNADGQITLVGNFDTYVSTFYERSVKGGPFLDIAKVRQLVRMNADGSMDSSFNYNPATKKGYDVGNGNIFDAIQLPDGRLVLVGNFTSFNGQSANHIIAINSTNGQIDPSFSIGSGADGDISRITYNSTTGKILLTGSFKNYNGQKSNGVVMLDESGQADPSFTFKEIDKGVVNFAGQLQDGKIIVSGSFNKYGNVVRPGLLILNADGTLASGYNNTGLFHGVVNDFVELTSAGTGQQQVILVGDFDRFDSKEVGNIVKFSIKN